MLVLPLHLSSPLILGPSLEGMGGRAMGVQSSAVIREKGLSTRLKLSGTYLRRDCAYGFPFYAWEYVADKSDVEVQIGFLELGFLWMERECRYGEFAGLASAGQKVEGQELHLVWA